MNEYMQYARNSGTTQRLLLETFYVTWAMDSPGYSTRERILAQNYIRVMRLVRDESSFNSTAIYGNGGIGFFILGGEAGGFPLKFENGQNVHGVKSEQRCSYE